MNVSHGFAAVCIRFQVGCTALWFMGSDTSWPRYRILFVSLHAREECRLTAQYEPPAIHTNSVHESACFDLLFVTCICSLQPCDYVSLSSKLCPNMHYQYCVVMFCYPLSRHDSYTKCCNQICVVTILHIMSVYSSVTCHLTPYRLLVQTFILCHLACCNLLLYRVSDGLMTRWQSVQNATGTVRLTSRWPHWSIIYCLV